MNNFSKFAIAGASLALGLASMNIKPAQAATITYDFDVNIDIPGALPEDTYKGFFSFDDSSVLPTGDVSVPVTDLGFNFLNIPYTEADDPNASVEFSDGNLLGLNFTTDAIFIVSPDSPTFGDSSFAYDVPSQGQGFGDVVYTERIDPQNPTTTPESTSLIGLLGLGAFAVGSLVKNKQK